MFDLYTLTTTFLFFRRDNFRSWFTMAVKPVFHHFLHSKKTGDIIQRPILGALCGPNDPRMDIYTNISSWTGKRNHQNGKCMLNTHTHRTPPLSSPIFFKKAPVASSRWGDVGKLESLAIPEKGPDLTKIYCLDCGGGGTRAFMFKFLSGMRCKNICILFTDGSPLYINIWALILNREKNL